MKRTLFLLMLCCLVTAQKKGNTLNDKALLDELLNTSSPPEIEEPVTQEPTEETPPVTAPPRSRRVSASQPADQMEPVDQQPVRPSGPDLEETPPVTPVKRPVRKHAPVARSVRSVTPDMVQEARVQETPDIPNFSHKAHIEDVGAECVQCHQTLFTESVRGIKSGPSMKEICSQCHNGTDAPTEAIAGFSDEKKYVKTHLPLFSHTVHIQNTEKCIVCHTDIYGDLKKIETPPPMTRCNGCHNNHRANSSCKVCHENPNTLKPKSHTSRWVYRNGHGKDARLRQNECRSCHAERDCNACHRGQNTFQVHSPGYKFTHGIDARQRSVNCGYCHDAQFSCVQCHERKR
jgi:predicted CXXCH cytochrome family protein